MVQIRSEIEMLQNPMLRKAYETIHFKADPNGAGNGRKLSDKPSVYIITKKCSINEQIDFMAEVKKHVSSNEPVNLLPSLKVTQPIRDFVFSTPTHTHSKHTDFFCPRMS